MIINHITGSATAPKQLSNMTEEQRAEAGRVLGYDMALIGLRSEYSDKYLEEGALECGSKRDRKDVFFRKWVQLRLGAYRRNIPFLNVQPAELQIITMHVPRCPLTLQPYIAGNKPGDDDNWSFDRIHNDVGYVGHNLTVMTTAANQKKGIADWREARDRQQFYKKKDDVEEFRFWTRLRSLLAPHYPEQVMPDGVVEDWRSQESLYDLIPYGRTHLFSRAIMGTHWLNTLATFNWDQGPDYPAVNRAMLDRCFPKLPSDLRRRTGKATHYIRSLQRQGVFMNDCYFDSTLQKNAVEIFDLATQFNLESPRYFRTVWQEMSTCAGNVMVSPDVDDVVSAPDVDRFR